MPIKKPTSSYQELRSPTRQDDKAVAEQKKAPAQQPSRKPVKKSPTPKVVPEISKSDQKPLTITVDAPPKGVSQVFDTLSADHGPEEAMRMILRKALKSFEVQLETGTVKLQQPDYQKGDITISTTKTLSDSAYQTAKHLFDPFDMLSNRKFSNKVAQAALNQFFASESKS